MDRIEEIRHNTQIDAHAMNHEPCCHTTHHPGCDCQVQRYIREKLDLLSVIDSLRKEYEELEQKYRKLLWLGHGHGYLKHLQSFSVGLSYSPLFHKEKNTVSIAFLRHRHIVEKRVRAQKGKKE